MKDTTPCIHPVLVLLWILLLSGSGAYSQSLVDGFMKGKGHGSAVLSYSWERYDQFYAGASKTDAPPPYGGQITTQSISVYGIVGLADALDLVVNVPYITAQGRGDRSRTDQSVGGLQDAALMLKWRPLKFENNQGKLSLLAAAGGATPLSNYAADSVLSIGNRATRIDGRLITQYVLSSGVFAELQAGYSVRNHPVPNATLLSAKVGFAASSFYLAVWSETQISDRDAPDIGAAPFSETRVNYTQMGISAYYPFSSSVGVSLGAAQYLAGRNVGSATRVSGGIIYNF